VVLCSAPLRSFVGPLRYLVIPHLIMQETVDHVLCCLQINSATSETFTMMHTSVYCIAYVD